jgi:hypothetical protein
MEHTVRMEARDAPMVVGEGGGGRRGDGILLFIMCDY